MKRLAGKVLLILLVIDSWSPARAELLTFNNLTDPNPGFNASFRPNLEIDGFVFESRGILDSVEIVFNPAACFVDCVGGDGPYLAAGGSGRITVLTRLDNSGFLLTFFDASKLTANPADSILSSPKIIVTGDLGNDRVVTVSFDLSEGFKRFSFPDLFARLRSITFSGTFDGNIDDNFALDNINVTPVSVTPVPEPNITLLVCFGLTIFVGGGATGLLELRNH